MAEEIDGAEGVVVPFPTMKTKREREKEEEREAMARLLLAHDDGAQWHPSGFSPVYAGLGLATAPLCLVGFTKLYTGR